MLVITDNDFRYALISAQVLTDSMYSNMIMGDIAWLDVRRIRGDNEVMVSERLDDAFNIPTGIKRKRDDEVDDVERDITKIDGGSVH